MLPCPVDPATADRCLVHVIEMPECMLFTSEDAIVPEMLRREYYDMFPQAGPPDEEVLLWRCFL